VKLRGERIKQLSAARGVAAEQLAQAVERPSLKGASALSAVRNWMRDNDHPAVKAADCQKIAAALGVQVSEIVKFTSRVLNHRGSPRKAKLLVDLIRGKQVDAALNMLTFTTKRAALNVKKCLSAAIADAEAFEADVAKLYVVESRCDDGVRIKRFQPKDRGRAHPIIKRMSNITVSVGHKAAGKKAK
jgi:large subunit ribosomal protein L22